MADGKPVTSTAAWAIPTGAWGRPAGSARAASEPVKAAAPATVPRAGFTPVHRRRRRSPRWRTAAVEAVVAAAVLTGVAIAAPGAATSPVSAPVSRWAHIAVPVINSLIADTEEVVSSGATRLGPLETELSLAAHLAPPPDSNVATVWYRGLGELTGGVQGLAAGAGQSPAALAALSSGAEALAAVEQSV